VKSITLAAYLRGRGMSGIIKSENFEFIEKFRLGLVRKLVVYW
jgi:hypothetical protein